MRSWAPFRCVVLISAVRSDGHNGAAGVVTFTLPYRDCPQRTPELLHSSISIAECRGRLWRGWRQLYRPAMCLMLRSSHVFIFRFPRRWESVLILIATHLFLNLELRSERRSRAVQPRLQTYHAICTTAQLTPRIARSTSSNISPSPHVLTNTARGTPSSTAQSTRCYRLDRALSASSLKAQAWRIAV
jgi:hypothetical protein